METPERGKGPESIIVGYKAERAIKYWNDVPEAGRTGLQAKTKIPTGPTIGLAHHMRGIGAIVEPMNGPK